MRLSEHTTESFFRGINDSAAPTLMRRGEVPVIENMRISPEGAVEVRYGSRKTHLAAINGGAPWYGMTKTPFKPNTGAAQHVGFCGNKAYKSTDKLTWTEIATGLREDYWSLTTMRIADVNHLLAVNGGDSGFKWDGATWSTLATLPAGVKVGQVYNGRYYISGHDGPVVLGSRVLNPEVYTGTFAVRVMVQTHDGDEEVNGLFQVSSYLLVYKRDSTSVITGSQQADLLVAAGPTGISRSVGLLGVRTPQAAGDAGCMWLSDRGIEYYLPGRGIRLISGNVRGFFGSVAWGDIVANPGIPDGLYLPNPGRHEYLLAVPGSGGRNDHTVRVHLSLPLPGEEGFAITIDPHAPSTGGTFYGDARGSLNYTTANDRLRVRSINGSMTLAEVGKTGLYVEEEAGGGLDVAEADYAMTCLFSADRDGVENAAPHAGCIDGFVRDLEKGEKDNEELNGSGGVAIAAKVRDAPGHFQAPNQGKIGRVVNALIASPAATTIAVAFMADGRQVDSKTVTVPASTDNEPVPLPPIRMVGRAKSNLQVEIRTGKAGLRIASISSYAEVLKARL